MIPDASRRALFARLADLDMRKTLAELEAEIGEPIPPFLGGARGLLSAYEIAPVLERAGADQRWRAALRAMPILGKPDLGTGEAESAATAPPAPPAAAPDNLLALAKSKAAAAGTEAAAPASDPNAQQPATAPVAESRSSAAANAAPDPARTPGPANIAGNMPQPTVAGSGYAPPADPTRRAQYDSGYAFGLELRASLAQMGLLPASALAQARVEVGTPAAVDDPQAEPEPLVVQASSANGAADRPHTTAENPAAASERPAATAPETKPRAANDGASETERAAPERPMPADDGEASSGLLESDRAVLAGMLLVPERLGIPEAETVEVARRIREAAGDPWKIRELRREITERYADNKTARDAFDLRLDIIREGPALSTVRYFDLETRVRFGDPEARKQFLDFLPIIGDIKTVADIYHALREADEAEARGDTALAQEKRGEAVLLAAMSLAGPLRGFAKRGFRRLLQDRSRTNPSTSADLVHPPTGSPKSESKIGDTTSPEPSNPKTPEPRGIKEIGAIGERIVYDAFSKALAGFPVKIRTQVRELPRPGMGRTTTDIFIEDLRFPDRVDRFEVKTFGSRYSGQQFENHSILGTHLIRVFDLDGNDVRFYRRSGDEISTEGLPLSVFLKEYMNELYGRNI